MPRTNGARPKVKHQRQHPNRPYKARTRTRTTHLGTALTKGDRPESARIKVFTPAGPTIKRYIDPAQMKKWRRHYIKKGWRVERI